MIEKAGGHRTQRLWTHLDPARQPNHDRLFLHLRPGRSARIFAALVGRPASTTTSDERDPVKVLAQVPDRVRHGRIKGRRHARDRERGTIPSDLCVDRRRQGIGDGVRVVADVVQVVDGHASETSGAVDLRCLEFSDIYTLPI